MELAVMACGSLFAGAYICLISQACLVAFLMWFGKPPIIQRKLDLSKLRDISLIRKRA